MRGGLQQVDITGSKVAQHSLYLQPTSTVNGKFLLYKIDTTESIAIVILGLYFFRNLDTATPTRVGFLWVINRNVGDSIIDYVTHLWSQFVIPNVL